MRTMFTYRYRRSTDGGVLSGDMPEVRMSVSICIPQTHRLLEVRNERGNEQLLASL